MNIEMTRDVITKKQNTRERGFELLAPAGSFEIFKAVIAAGADAVYVGGDLFGARAYANNFSTEELLAAIDYAHLHGAKVYLTVNTLLKNTELTRKLYDYLLPFYEQGLDAVLVQDMGVFSFVRKNFQDLPIHTSTQMTVTGVQGAKMMQRLGAERVVMAREVSLAEMKRIYDETGVNWKHLCTVHCVIAIPDNVCSAACSVVEAVTEDVARSLAVLRIPYLMRITKLMRKTVMY